MQRPAGVSPETTPTWSERSRRRTSFYLVVALLLAVLAGLLSYNFLDQIRQKSVPSARAVVARVSIPPATAIDEDMVELRSVPEAVLPAGAVRSMGDVLGRESAFPIEANEVVLGTRLSGNNASTLSGRLPEGRWAMVLPGSWLASPLPEISVGDRVDLLATHLAGEGMSVGLLVQNIHVLALSGETLSPDSITLSVDVAQAENILVARANGFLILALLRPTGG